MKTASAPTLRTVLLLLLCVHWTPRVAAAAASSDERRLPMPAFPVRVLYAPAHFGNSYEVMGEREMRAVLAEAQHWGFNRYGDWFDMLDCGDPFAETQHVHLAHALWARKKANFLSAQALGLDTELMITPNHVYLDQCLPERLAQKGGRIFGQLVCPSKPDARAAILTNYDHLFADLARAGVRLDAICCCPYDYGGCSCDACQPWILTFARLSRDIFALAQKHHRGVQMDMVGWWWSAQEHKQFAEWADREAPGWVQWMFLHIPYGKTDVADVPLPKGCRRGGFVHIGYADQASPRDVYGHLGPVIAPVRLERTVASLRGHKVGGVMAYSEGVSDDANKALLAALTSGKHKTADVVLKAYARRYFATSPKQAAAWAAWLKPWGRPFEVDVSKVAQALAPLREREAPAELREGEAPAEPTWRVEHWPLKLELLRLHHAIMSTKTWTKKRLALGDEFWATQERIHRGLWGLGPQRHIFHRRFSPFPWYRSWAQHAAKQVRTMGKEQ